MPKSRNRKQHKKKVQNFRKQLDVKRESYKRRVIDEFIARQNQSNQLKEEYKTTEEVNVDIDTSGLNLDDLTMDLTESEIVETDNIETKE